MLARNTEMYLDWLSALVESARPGQTFLCLFRELNRIKFMADIRVPLDSNRVTDALEMRAQFFMDADIQDDIDFEEDRVSMLELLMSLAFTMGELTSREDNIPSYFFDLLENLEICIPDSEYIDQDRANAFVYSVAQKVIKRRYGRKGLLFPLRNPKMDQRHAEIWYQLQAYLIEQEEA